MNHGSNYIYKYVVVGSGLMKPPSINEMPTRVAAVTVAQLLCSIVKKLSPELKIPQ